MTDYRDITADESQEIVEFLLATPAGTPDNKIFSGCSDSESQAMIDVASYLKQWPGFVIKPTSGERVAFKVMVGAKMVGGLCQLRELLHKRSEIQVRFVWVLNLDGLA